MRRGVLFTPTTMNNIIDLVFQEHFLERKNSGTRTTKYQTWKPPLHRPRTRFRMLAFLFLYLMLAIKALWKASSTPEPDLEEHST